MLRHHALFCLLGILTYCVISSVAIIDGHLAGKNAFAYQVSLQLQNNRHFCGGAIIEDLFIVTAASCVILSTGVVKTGRITVLAGTNDLRETGKPAMKIQVKTVYALKEYDPRDKRPTGDIAVLRLLKPLGLSKGVSRHYNIRALQLPYGHRANANGKQGKITGWGWDWIGRNRMHTADDRLRFSDADVITSNECKNSHLCARVKQRDSFKTYGACYGDIGGPLVTDDGTTLLGILSENQYDCTERVQPGLYTRVSHFLHFIENAKKGRKATGMIVKDLIPSFP